MMTEQTAISVNPAPSATADFYVVGAAKAGTTAIHHWLKDHPEVYLPQTKEPGYFAFAGKSAVPAQGPYDPDYVATVVTESAAYAALYSGADGRLRGDISPVYLLDPRAASRIAAVRPDARIIIVLRDPVKRAFSQFLHHTRDGLEPCESFEAALNAEEERLRAGWSWGHGYATHGHYVPQIRRYLAAFPRAQVLFLEFDALKSEPELCWRKICQHLGLTERPLLHNAQVNVTAGLASVTNRPGLTRALRHPGAVQSLLKSLMPPPLRRLVRPLIEGRGRALPLLREDTRRALAQAYRGERAETEGLTGLDLSHWSA